MLCSRRAYVNIVKRIYSSISMDSISHWYPLLRNETYMEIALGIWSWGTYYGIYLFYPKKKLKTKTNKGSTKRTLLNNLNCLCGLHLCLQVTFLGEYYIYTFIHWGMHALRPSGPVSDAAASVVSHGSQSKGLANDRGWTAEPMAPSIALKALDLGLYSKATDCKLPTGQITHRMEL